MRTEELVIILHHVGNALLAAANQIAQSAPQAAQAPVAQAPVAQAPVAQAPAPQVPVAQIGEAPQPVNIPAPPSATPPSEATKAFQAFQADARAIVQAHGGYTHTNPAVAVNRRYGVAQISGLPQEVYPQYLREFKYAYENFEEYQKWAAANPSAAAAPWAW